MAGNVKRFHPKNMLRKQVIIDTDIGDYMDDAFALGFALSSPEFEIRAILTNNGHERVRAQIVRKLVECLNRDIPVFQGVRGGRGRLSQGEFVKDSRFEPPKLRDNVDFFREAISSKVHYISLGALTNVRFLLEHIPNIEDEIELLIMGGSIETDYDGKKALVPEYNLASDIESSQRIFGCAAKITLITLDCTWNLGLTAEAIRQIQKSKSQLNRTLIKLCSYWERARPGVNTILCDPFAIALLTDSSLATFQDCRITVDNAGRTMQDSKVGKHVRVAIESDKRRFLALFMQRLLLSP